MVGRFKRNGQIYEDGFTTVFPIIQISAEKYDFVGTAFFIAPNGTFCTAKHVLYKKNFKNEDVINDDLFSVFFYRENGIVKYDFRKIINIVNTSKADIVIGMVEPLYNKEGQFIKNTVMNLTQKPIKIGDFVATCAYPKSKIIKDGILTVLDFVTTWHFGRVVEEFPDGRDSSMMPGACYQTTIEILGGASGGPVGNEKGHICGINSTGYSLEDEDNVSFITPISEIFNMQIGTDSGTYTIKDLIPIM